MDDTDGLIIFFLVVVVSVLVIFGVITFIKKSAQLIPEPERGNSALLIKKQKERTEQIKDRQKKIMEDNRQRYQDYRSRSNQF